jgi:hydroxymethylpyrimidine/phosphomethylpyrimidine kinase
VSSENPQPCALTIAGSDSGGGAGIQADLKTFASLGVHGTTVVTCVTAQSPAKVLGLEPCSPKIVRQQIEAVFAELPPSAVKTGMLWSREIIREVADFFRRKQQARLVVDPVMVATSGARLLKPGAVTSMQKELLPLASLVTPNLQEAEILTGLKLSAPEDLRTAAKMIRRDYGCAVLIKGGHLKNSREAIDIYYDGQTELL